MNGRPGITIDCQQTWQHIGISGACHHCAPVGKAGQLMPVMIHNYNCVSEHWLVCCLPSAHVILSFAACSTMTSPLSIVKSSAKQKAAESYDRQNWQKKSTQTGIMTLPPTIHCLHFDSIWSSPIHNAFELKPWWQPRRSRRRKLGKPLLCHVRCGRNGWNSLHLSVVLVWLWWSAWLGILASGAVRHSAWKGKISVSEVKFQRSSCQVRPKATRNHLVRSTSESHTWHGWNPFCPMESLCSASGSTSMDHVTSWTPIKFLTMASYLNRGKEPRRNIYITMPSMHMSSDKPLVFWII